MPVCKPTWVLALPHDPNYYPFAGAYDYLGHELRWRSKHIHPGVTDTVAFDDLDTLREEGRSYFFTEDPEEVAAHLEAWKHALVLADEHRTPRD